jgi:hypothetical protein
MTGFQSPKFAKAIWHAVDEARLAYQFCPGSYTASALNACLAVEQAYREAARPCLDHHDTPGGERSNIMHADGIQRGPVTARGFITTPTPPNQTKPERRNNQ